jgi:hypothetical protein
VLERTRIGAGEGQGVREFAQIRGERRAERLGRALVIWQYDEQAVERDPRAREHAAVLAGETLGPSVGDVAEERSAGARRMDAGRGARACSGAPAGSARRNR